MLIDFSQPYEIALESSCGCRSTWPMYHAPRPEDAVLRTSGPCIPEYCDTCLDAEEPCAARRQRPAYRPIEWQDVNTMPRKRWTRMRQTAPGSQ